MHVTEELQRRVARHFGADNPEEELQAMRAMRRAAVSGAVAGGFAPLYVRFQRARKGSLQVGDRAPDCSLLYPDGTGTSLHEQIAGPGKTCILAGSYS